MSLLPLLKLIGTVHLFQLHLSLLAQLWMIDQIAFDRLYNALLLTIDEYFLDAEEGFFNSARVINVDIII